MKVIFNNFVVNKSTKSILYVSLYFDFILKQNVKSNTFDFDTACDDGISIFRFLDDKVWFIWVKDIFERYYKNHLAKRLLSKKVDYDSEKSIISKLRVLIQTDQGWMRL